MESVPTEDIFDEFKLPAELKTGKRTVQIKEMLKMKVPRNRICEHFGVSYSAVAYHATKLGLSRHQTKQQDLALPLPSNEPFQSVAIEINGGVSLTAANVLVALAEAFREEVIHGRTQGDFRRIRIENAY